MLPSDRDYVEGMKLKHKDLKLEIMVLEKCVEFVFEEGEEEPGDIDMLLTELELKRGQEFFAGCLISLLTDGTIPEPKPRKRVRQSGEITDLMIEQAREYPIENLLEVKRKKALCPFHDDHNPSMSVKGNLYHCFSCGASGDVIRFVMELENLNFKDAVRYLNGR